MDVVLACDLGTSSVKLTAVDITAAAGADPVIGVASRPYPTRHDADGWAEQDPQDWLNGFAAALGDLQHAGALRAVRAIAFTGQMSAALPVDRAGEALHPALIWSDQRAVQETELAGRRIQLKRFYALTGNTLNATDSGPKLAWLKRHRPEVWARTATFLQPKDWLIAQLTGAQLTGVLAMDHSDASCTGLYDIAAGAWSPELFDVFGLPTSIAPEIQEAATQVGTLGAAMARRLGLPEGLPVILGGGDGPTSALGAGIGAGEAYLSLGTSAWVSFLHDRPIEDGAQRVFSFRHVLPGLYAVTGSTQNAGNVFAWLTGVLQAGDMAAEIREALRTVEPGCGGLAVLPYLQGERTPVWDSLASGAVLGLRSHHGRPHLIRAFAEAVCFQINLILETFAECGLSAPALRVVGGLSSEPLLMDLLATVTGRVLSRPSAFLHTTSMGAAMVGALTLGAGLDGALLLNNPSQDVLTTPKAQTSELQQASMRFSRIYPALQALLPPSLGSPASGCDA